MDLAPIFFRNSTIAGGPASVTTYDKQVLLDAVLKGEIHPGKVFTRSFKLDDVQAAYEAMDNREAIKSYLIVD
jgi:alcohol dehydrogenase